MVKYGEIQEKDRHNMWVADKIHAQIRVVPYRLWGFQYSPRYHKWGIGIGSSPIGYEGCNLGKAKAKQKLN